MRKLWNCSKGGSNLGLSIASPAFYLWATELHTVSSLSSWIIIPVNYLIGTPETTSKDLSCFARFNSIAMSKTWDEQGSLSLIDIPSHIPKECNQHSFWSFSSIKKLPGQTEMQTHERKKWQSIQTIWDISRDDRARTAACSLRTATDRFKENYNIETSAHILVFLVSPYSLQLLLPAIDQRLSQTGNK